MSPDSEETIADRYRRLASAFGVVIDAVPGEAWNNPSPCEGWSARDVANHVVETQTHFLSFIGEEAGEIPDPKVDPSGAWRAASAEIQRRLDDPALASKEFEGFQGTTRWDEFVDRLINFDLTVHPWDVATAAGLDHRIEPQDIERCRTVAEGFGEAMRSPTAFGPELDAPDGADGQQKFLAFLGRRV